MINNPTTKELLLALDRFNALDIRSSINYEQMNEILISHHSTAIEGSSLTLEESRLLLSEGIVAKGKPFEDHNMVKDHYEALKWMIEKAGQARQGGQTEEAGHHTEINPAFI